MGWNGGGWSGSPTPTAYEQIRGALFGLVGVVYQGTPTPLAGSLPGPTLAPADGALSAQAVQNLKLPTASLIRQGGVMLFPGLNSRFEAPVSTDLDPGTDNVLEISVAHATGVGAEIGGKREAAGDTAGWEHTWPSGEYQAQVKQGAGPLVIARSLPPQNTGQWQISAMLVNRDHLDSAGAPDPRVFAACTVTNPTDVQTLSKPLPAGTLANTALWSIGRAMGATIAGLVVGLQGQWSGPQIDSTWGAVKLHEAVQNLALLTISELVSTRLSDPESP